MKYSLLNQVIGLMEEFESSNSLSGNNDLIEFLGFLNNKLSDSSIHNNTIISDDKTNLIYHGNFTVEATISGLIVNLSRYAKNYIKIVLEGTVFTTVDDFTYLASLLENKNLTKTELINKNIQEKSTGTEIIKRLLNLELVSQTEDTIDKRSKILNITETGRQALFLVFENMNIASHIINGELSFAEKMNLYHLLKKLDSFHWDVYNNKKLNNMEELRDIKLSS